MKSFLKLFYVVIVAIVVFTGALLIAQGTREHEEKKAETNKSAVSGLPDAVLSSGEGSAL